jgi:hypothetical protein
MEVQTTPTEEQNAPTTLIDLPEQASGWEDRGPLPFFRSLSFEQHVNEWRLVDREAQDRTWKLAAIAASLVRSPGGRPRDEKKRIRTAIQEFCAAVKIDRQTFHRLSSTYKKIADLARVPDATSFDPDLSFKHYEIAARLAGVDALDAIAQARENGWSANTLQRVLSGQRGKSQKRRRVSFMKTRERIRGMFEPWSEHDKQHVAPMLRDLANEYERMFGPVPSVIEFIERELEPHLPFDGAAQEQADDREQFDDDLLDDYYVPDATALALHHDSPEEAPF